MDFGIIKTGVARQFQAMQAHPMFRVDIDGDTLWSTYLASFPPGTNPLFRERTEHDCSCCRHFVRSMGDVVALMDGELVSVWDVQVSEEPAYAAVVAALAGLVRSRPIAAPFLHSEPVAGTDRSFEMDPESVSETPAVKTWTHFFVNIDRRHVKAKDAIPTDISERRSQHDVFLRSLREITSDAIDNALELIAQGSLYRGEEHRATVLQFKTARAQFLALPDERAQDIFAWTADTSGAVARIRNTVIGTLLVDLSEGKDLEDAVRSFEAKVATQNYKRPSALITRGMIEKAKAQIEELGLTSALDRRYARLGDITINNLIWADRATRKSLSGNVFDDLAATAVASPNLDKVEEIPIDRFVAEVIPRADSIEVLLENRHQGNLVSLIAPVDPTARNFFKWDNNFSWSYAGEMADAIKERVKRAGGNVAGDLCCRLAWFNFDDLDFHMKEPDGYEIFFGNRQQYSPSSGRLDVDMNISPTTREPVENIFYGDRNRMKEGKYRLIVHQYNARESSNVGFEVEVDYLGTVHRFTYAQAVRHNESVTVLRFRYTHKGGMEILESLPSTQAVRTLWKLPTQSFHRVSGIMLSPNYWDGRGIGNRHHFFMLEGCENDGSSRGFFNEFLREDLNPHRKVFEVLATRMKPADSSDQLSGIGFSSTQRNTAVCRVKGSFTRTVKVLF